MHVPIWGEARIQKEAIRSIIPKKWISEAELVKAFRGEALETEKPAAESETEKVHDLVLQRAVDVLKAIRMLVSQQ